MERERRNHWIRGDTHFSAGENACARIRGQSLTQTLVTETLVTVTLVTVVCIRLLEQSYKTLYKVLYLGRRSYAEKGSRTTQSLCLNVGQHVWCEPLAGCARTTPRREHLPGHYRQTFP